MSKHIKSIPTLQTGNRHQRRKGTFDESNLLIVDMWHKEEEKRRAREQERKKAYKGKDDE